MPTAIDARRALLRGLAGSAGLLVAGARSGMAAVATPAALAATWERHGRFGAGLLVPEGGAWVTQAAIALPGRAHGILAEPEGTLLVVARRPGDWLVRIDPSGLRPPRWSWSDGETQFNGHVIRSLDGTRLYTSETDRLTGEGVIVVRDPSTMAALDRWPVGGLDPHELAATADGGLWVAVGGIEVRPETGRVKHDLADMDSSLVRLAADGRETGRWRLKDPRLGLRHLAPGTGGRIGLALQAEHDDAAARRAAPVLAVWDPDAGLVAVPPPAGVVLHGYGGSIAATADGFVIGCPRADRVAMFRLAAGRPIASGTWDPDVTLAQACAVAARPLGMDTVRGLSRSEVAGPHAAWAGGVGAIARVSDGAVRAFTIDPALRLDNHWAIMPAPRG